MKTSIKIFFAAALLVLAGLLFGGCSPGNAPADIPGGPDVPDPGTTGGDPREPVFYAPSAVGQLQDGQAFDSALVDVTANEEFVYVLSKNQVYAFSKTSNFLNVAPISNPVGKGIAVIPDNPGGLYQNRLPKHVFVSHTPGDGGGDPSAATIYAPNLDPLNTRLDENQPPFAKTIEMPRYFDNENVIPNATQPDPVPGDDWQIVDIMGADVTRNGSIVCKAQMGWLDRGEALLDYVDPIADELILFDAANADFPFQMYFVDYWDDPHNPTIPDDPTPVGVPVPFWDDDPVIAVPAHEGDIPDRGPYTNGMNYSVGEGTSFAFALPFDLTAEEPQDFFVNDSILSLDFIGVSTFVDKKLDNVDFPNFDFSYTFSRGGSGADVMDDYKVIIGKSYGAAPGSFAPNPPAFDGALEDPDVDQGGPAGMGWDSFNRRLYVCDPGNRRVQVFQQDDTDGSYDYFGQIGNGIRGTTGNNLIAPKAVHVDRNGTVYICDVDRIRIFNRDTGGNIGFGSLAGTVRKMPGNILMPDATVTISGSQGPVATIQTDINGQYRVDNLATGRYFVTASAEMGNLEDDFANVTILFDQTSVANFNLWDKDLTRPVTGTVIGTVYDDVTGKPLADATVRLVDQNSKIFTTSVLGTFTIPDIEAGYWDSDNVWHPTTWQVIVSADLYNTATSYFELLPSSTVTIEIRLRPKNV